MFRKRKSSPEKCYEACRDVRINIFIQHFFSAAFVLAEGRKKEWKSKFLSSVAWCLQNETDAFCEQNFFFLGLNFAEKYPRSVVLRF